VSKRSIAIPARELELREPEQGVSGLRRQRVIDDYVLVVTFRVGRI
jgi:hypothetical protein